MQLLCMRCKKSVGVTPDDGVVHVRYVDMQDYRDAMQIWKEKAGQEIPGLGVMYSGPELTEMPTPAGWRVHCTECSPDDCAGCYWFDAIRAGTPARLLRWTAHLMEKSWLTDTNWGEFIRAYGEDA
jgi:hypothetical protein